MKLLDLYSGAGGAARGYQQAGFHVTGVDIRPQPRYAGDAFVLGDALEYLAAHGSDYDAIHASPPCQRYSVSTVGLRNAGTQYPDLLGPTRDHLAASGRPYVIENVAGAPLRPDIVLCGCMFPDELPGLRRERWFETSWGGWQMRQPCHHPDPIVTVVGHGPASNSYYRNVHGSVWTQLRQRAMGIDWMNRDELSEAIPPRFTEHIGTLLLDHITEGVAA